MRHATVVHSHLSRYSALYVDGVRHASERDLDVASHLARLGAVDVRTCTAADANFADVDTTYTDGIPDDMTMEFPPLLADVVVAYEGERRACYD